MKKIIIVHDCKDEKLIALNGVCIEHIGMHKFELKFFEKETFIDIPKSTDELAERLNCNLSNLLRQYSESGEDKDAVVYFASLQKCFIKMDSHFWLITAFAKFGRIPGFVYPGASESFPVHRLASEYVDLPEKERHEKFFEFREKFKIEAIPKTNEVDWCKQAFRNCVPIAVSDN